MGQHILPGTPPVEVNLKRSARARRISLRVSGVDGRVTLTLPRGVSDREGLAFAREKASWLRGHLDQRAPEVTVAIGATIPVEGIHRAICAAPGRGVRLTENELLVAGAPDSAARRIQAYLRELARDRLASASDRHAAALGRDYARLTLRDTRSRWGSCTADGGLMYSWRLILAPAEVLDYVAAHEVAHLAEMNHSRAFWALVEQLYGPYAAPRQWLRDHGAGLHGYRFDG
ncbi:SprT family zinc-dependent metalloprotease [Pseudooceanicola sp.]|uniref:M48 family metallopeptidase n=1 Tax=Pseudooceanicola sp. TaxID=1914328 RepID=UPI00260D11BF|nr:SprT family zinc-dependent metalloprotease [Pseudooceanicola sp.]MDF1857007.1 SprT family zinc-dependent metalloprotease [Pseudooceanicola sp.]